MKVKLLNFTIILNNFVVNVQIDFDINRDNVYCRLSSDFDINRDNVCYVLQEEGEEEDKMPGEIWQIKKISDCDFWFLKTGMLNLS